VDAVVIRRALVAAPLALALCLAACLTPEPSLEQRAYAPVGKAMERVVVVPFYLHPTYDASNRMGSVPPESASERVTRHVVDALRVRGVGTPTAVEIDAVVGTFERRSAALDGVLLAEIAGRQLSATGVIVGEVLRYREPRGAAASNRTPASVAYQLTLYEAPSGYKLRTIRFDETQVITDADRGSGEAYAEQDQMVHYKSAEELSHWGADAIARALVPDS
jgi:hypothetical protein